MKPSTSFFTFFLIIIFFSFVFINSVQAQSRSTLPNDFGIELLGKSAIYSFSYQRMVTPTLGLQGSFAALGGSGDVVMFFPIGGKLYFVPKDGSPFISGGIVFLTDFTDAGPLDGETTYGYAGLGFEFRSNSGLLFRGTAYALFAKGGFFIWPGLHIGYAF